MVDFDKTKILALLDKMAKLEQVDVNLTQEILGSLGLEGACALGTVLNSELDIERKAAIDMINKNLEKLLSEDEKIVKETQDILGDFYYCVDTSGILEP